jgi:3-hydroxyisobutyrate dehydrogenase
MEKIGFIGFGKMGIPISRRIAKKFTFTAVYNRTASKVPKDFKELSVDTPGEVAKKCDIIFMIVTDSQASETLLKSILSMGDLKGKIIVDMSTISHEQSLANGENCKAKECQYVDSPVIGSIPAAESGTLTTVCGGDQKTFNVVLEYLRTFTAKQIYAGKQGNGIALKLINNLIMGINMVAVSEGLSMAESLGIDFDDFTNGIQSGGASSKILELKKEKLRVNDFSPQFSLKDQFKDLNYAIELQKKVGSPDLMASLADSIYSMEIAEHGKDDLSAVFNFYRKLKRNE